MRKIALMLLILACLGLSLTPASGASDFALSLAPSLAAVSPGESANYTITITSIDAFQGFVFISVEGLPSGASYFFTSANPVSVGSGQAVNQTLVVTTTSSVYPGAYLLEISGKADVTIHLTTATLFVYGEAVGSLFASVSTNKLSYSAGEEVTVFGCVNARFGGYIADATVSIKVVNPSGIKIHSSSILSDSTGHYATRFTLRNDCKNGTYTVYSTASRYGYLEGRSYTTFTVGVSGRPKILSVTCTDTNGTPRSNFKAGSTVIVWVTVNNTGAELKNGLVWIEIDDPNSVPITVMFQYATLSQGETFTAGFSITLTTLGQYKAIAFVSNKLISQGGRFLTTPVEATFTVTD